MVVRLFRYDLVDAVAQRIHHYKLPLDDDSLFNYTKETLNEWEDKLTVNMVQRF